jgi:hypothetical protein
MHWFSTRLIAVALAAAALVGCGGPRETETDNRATLPAPATGEALDVVEATPERVRGSYRAETGTALSFDTVSVNGVARLDLTGATGRALLHVEQSGDVITMVAYGGEAKMVVDLAVLRKSQELGANPDMDPGDFMPSEGLRIEGDQSLFERLSVEPELMALPYLSAKLGRSGMDGGKFPATVGLHWLAMKSATDQGLDVGPLGRDEAGGAGDEAYCQDLQGDPCGDQSLGMCGPGTTCWQWTCGDCCCHSGCKNHDKSCRSCKWYKPWNCLLCYTGTSFLAGACTTCDSCGDVPPYYEPECKPSGSDYYCGQHSECCDHRDNSTEAQGGPVQAFCAPDNKCHACWDGSVWSMTFCW